MPPEAGNREDQVLRIATMVHLLQPAVHECLCCLPRDHPDRGECDAASQSMTSALGAAVQKREELAFEVYGLKVRCGHLAALARGLADQPEHTARAQALTAHADRLDEARAGRLPVLEYEDVLRMKESTTILRTVRQLLVSVDTTFTQAGWPRPYADYAPRDGALRQLPVPWIVGSNARYGQWMTFRPHLRESYLQRLCAVCGLTVTGTLLFGALSDGEDGPESRITSGPGCCARCMLVALKSCPYLANEADSPDGPAAWAYDGPGHGLYDDEHTKRMEAAVSVESRGVSVDEIREIARIEAGSRAGDTAS